MRYKSRRRLTIESRILASMLLLTIGLSVFSQQQKIVWLQVTTVFLLIGTGLFMFRLVRELKQCFEPATPESKKSGRQFALAWALIIIAVMFVEVVRGANTPHAWFLFVLISASLLVGVFWERPPPKGLTKR
jgi:intracellular septation protein A